MRAVAAQVVLPVIGLVKRDLESTAVRITPTLDDVAAFEPLFEDGVLAPPRWLPRWVSRANGLAGVLAFSLFANRIRLDRLSADG